MALLPNVCCLLFCKLLPSIFTYHVVTSLSVATSGGLRWQYADYNRELSSKQFSNHYLFYTYSEAIMVLLSTPCHLLIRLKFQKY